MEPVKASSVDMTRCLVGGVACYPNGEILPGPGSLCMGFSWSLYFSQQGSEGAMEECENLSESRLVTDRSKGMVFDASKQDAVRHTA